MAMHAASHVYVCRHGIQNPRHRARQVKLLRMNRQFIIPMSCYTLRNRKCAAKLDTGTAAYQAMLLCVHGIYVECAFGTPVTQLAVEKAASQSSIFDAGDLLRTGICCREEDGKKVRYLKKTGEVLPPLLPQKKISE